MHTKLFMINVVPVNQSHPPAVVPGRTVLLHVSGVTHVFFLFAFYAVTLRYLFSCNPRSKSVTGVQCTRVPAKKSYAGDAFFGSWVCIKQSVDVLQQKKKSVRVALFFWYARKYTRIAAKKEKPGPSKMTGQTNQSQALTDSSLTAMTSTEAHTAALPLSSHAPFASQVSTKLVGHLQPAFIRYLLKTYGYHLEGLRIACQAVAAGVRGTSILLEGNDASLQAAQQIISTEQAVLSQVCVCRGSCSG